MPITKFGIGENTSYDFTQTGVYIQDYDDNFGDSADVTAEFGGMDGVYLLDGDGASRKPGGNITLGIKIRAENREDMRAKRQALYRIRNYGLQILVNQPLDTNLPTLFTYAKAQVSLPKDEKNHSDLFQDGTVRFLIPDPYWYATSQGQGYIIGINFLMGISTLGSNPIEISASGTQTDEVISHGGTARTLVKLTIEPGSGQSCENPTIQRIVDGEVHDEVSYTGTLTFGDVFVIDSANIAGPQVTLNGSDAFDTDFDFKHPRFMSLLPGDNTIRVEFANGGDDALVTLEFLDCYEGA